MVACTKSTKQRGYGILCSCAVLVFSVLDSWTVSTLAAPEQQQKLVAVAARQEQIVETIRGLKQSQQRWIEVDLSDQRLIAWEGKKSVRRVMVSTGKRSTPTLTGTFKIQSKLQKGRMKGDDYDIPDVPHIMYYEGSYAIHGAYWHNSFGTPVSHGCVNVSPKQATWLFNWAQVGTSVVVRQ